MKEENKKEIKKGILTGAGTAAGAVIGAVVENTMNAADADVKEIPEAEVVEAIAEDIQDNRDSDQSTVEIESISMDTVNPESIPHTNQPVRIPAQNDAESSFIETASEGEMESVIDAEAVIESDVEEESETETVNAEETMEDEDIEVVSIESELPEEGEEDNNETPETIECDEIEVDGNEGPDYTDIKDNDSSIGNPTTSALDMPDYVNDANIDSFTDNL